MSETIINFRKFVDLIEGRAMACDGPVTPFLDQLQVASDAEKERFTAILSEIYKSPPPADPSATDPTDAMIAAALNVDWGVDIPDADVVREIWKEMRAAAPNGASAMDPAPSVNVMASAVTGQMEIDPGVTAADLGVNAEPDRLWLSAGNSDGEHQVWFDPDEGGTMYIRADLFPSPAPNALGIEEAALQAVIKEMMMQQGSANNIRQQARNVIKAYLAALKSEGSADA